MDTQTKILREARARPLTLRQQQRLARAAQAGDKRAGTKLVESCLGLVVAMATDEGRGGVVREMVQNGVVEMLERLYGRPNKRYPDRDVVRYDPDRDIKFWTFVRPYVLAAILDTFEKPATVPLESVEKQLVEEDSAPAGLIDEWTQEAYRAARTAVNELPEPDRSLCILKYGLGHWGGKSRAEAAWIVGVSDRHAKTALQRAGKELRRDRRVRALKGLLGYESAQDLRDLQERSQRLLAAAGPAAPPRPVVPYQGHPEFDIDVFPGLKVRPAQVWRGTPTEDPRRYRYRPTERLRANPPPWLARRIELQRIHGPQAFEASNKGERYERRTAREDFLLYLEKVVSRPPYEPIVLVKGEIEAPAYVAPLAGVPMYVVFVRDLYVRPSEGGEGNDQYEKAEA
jgi:hypothetical protein